MEDIGLPYIYSSHMFTIFFRYQLVINISANINQLHFSFL